MKTFNISIELTPSEILLLKSMDWNQKEPKTQIGMDFQTLIEKGVVYEIYCQSEYETYLTEIGEQILKSI